MGQDSAENPYVGGSGWGPPKKSQRHSGVTLNSILTLLSVNAYSTLSSLRILTPKKGYKTRQDKHL